MPCERLIDLKDVRDKIDAGRAIVIISSVNSPGLYRGRIAFHSYDFTYSMSGERDGAQAIVSQLLGRDATYIPCQSHRFSTNNEHACDATPVVVEVFNTL